MWDGVKKEFCGYDDKDEEEKKKSVSLEMWWTGGCINPQNEIG